MPQIKVYYTRRVWDAIRAKAGAWAVPAYALSLSNFQFAMDSRTFGNRVTITLNGVTFTDTQHSAARQSVHNAGRTNGPKAFPQK